MATSSAAVSTSRNAAGWRAASASSESGASSYQYLTCASVGQPGNAAASSAGQAPVAQRVRGLGLVDDVGELLGAQQRHGGHGDAAGLDHREPARRHHRVVRAAQQHPVAGHQPHLAHQHVRQAIRLRQQLGVAALSVGRAQRDPLAVAARQRAVEQLDGAVHARRISELRQLEQELRPLLARRKVVARERVEMRRVAHFSSSLAMISFCTSVAPS